MSKITFHGDVPQSALEWGLAWKVRRKVCTFHAYMPYMPLQQGSAWKVILIKSSQQKDANTILNLEFDRRQIHVKVYACGAK